MQFEDGVLEYSAYDCSSGFGDYSLHGVDSSGYDAADPTHLLSSDQSSDERADTQRADHEGSERSDSVPKQRHIWDVICDSGFEHHRARDNSMQRIVLDNGWEISAIVGPGTHGSRYYDFALLTHVDDFSPQWWFSCDECEVGIFKPGGEWFPRNDTFDYIDADRLEHMIVWIARGEPELAISEDWDYREDVLDILGPGLLELGG